MNPAQRSRARAVKMPSRNRTNARIREIGDLGCRAGLQRWQKTNGRRRRIVVDTLGLILAAVVHPTSVQDYDGTVLVFGALAQLKARFHRLKVHFRRQRLWPKQLIRMGEGSVRMAVTNSAAPCAREGPCGAA
jgi:putative transposase